jgi:phenylpropionate dioxygenase-like ring-hydroxylating dioxygenase large terminal subunit
MESEAARVTAPDLRRVGLHPDFWYPLARSSDVPRGRTCLALFGGEPIVLARGEDGRVFALDDRCAHRQYPLHQGVVTGNRLRCAYHAWSYGADGHCAVPYLPREACRPRGVKSYACREAYGYVFVFPGEQTNAAAVPFPELPSFHSPRRRTMHFWRKVACHYSFMHENLMDMHHQFLHRGILGSLKPTLIDHQRGHDWVEARYLFRNSSGKRDRGADLMLAGGRRADGTSGTVAAPEDGDLMVIRTQYPYQTLSLRRAGAVEPAFDLWAAYVPWDRAQRSHISVGMLMIEKPRIPGIIHLFWPFIRRFTESVFTEDRNAVEAEQRAYDAQQGDWNQEINPVILDLRDLLLRSGVSLAR